MRVLAIDLGLKRVGLAVSDSTRTLATPLKVVQGSGDIAEIVEILRREILDLAEEEDGVQTVVIGLPGRLDGTEHERAPWTRAVAAALAAAVDLPIVLQDERLSSREAEERLSIRERDWRRRKAKLDAAAAAIVLQDYLDEQKRNAT
ncbi:MAG: Holliday junction resolvase RuvX [Acidobacteria bacterium]|nr:Holliday junction resolvase RuvX [Acidobacteriota bacterium]